MADERVIPAEMGADLLDAYRIVKAENVRLREALEEKHQATGFCPLCEAGPPPYHNPGCLLGPGSEGEDG